MDVISRSINKVTHNCKVTAGSSLSFFFGSIMVCKYCNLMHKSECYQKFIIIRTTDVSLVKRSLDGRFCHVLVAIVQQYPSCQF
jgi:hypothetical protein